VLETRGKKKGKRTRIRPETMTFAKLCIGQPIKKKRFETKKNGGKTEIKGQYRGRTPKSESGCMTLQLSAKGHKIAAWFSCEEGARKGGGRLGQKKEGMSAGWRIVPFLWRLWREEKTALLKTGSLEGLLKKVTVGGKKETP